LPGEVEKPGPRIMWFDAGEQRFDSLQPPSVGLS